MTSKFQSQGRLTHGPEVNAQVKKTLAFVQNELPQWRDRPKRRTEIAEESLNAQLCKHLNSRARKNFQMVMFHHEEKQAKGRRVDISAGLTEDGFVGATYHTIDDPFLVFEGKRLPPPGGKTREREYLTGGKDVTGGIQRFKLGLHGGQLETAVMIGYIQKDSLRQWYDRLNQWIRELVEAKPTGEEKWELDEVLERFAEENGTQTACCVSLNSRNNSGGGGKICIHHFWVRMHSN